MSAGKVARIGVVMLAAGALSGVMQAQQPTGEAGAMAMGAGRMVRGTVTVATADRLTIKTETGEVYQVVISPNTRMSKGREPVKLADVHAGDGVGAMGEIDPATKTVHALFVGVMDAEQMKKAREAMGKTYIAGKVTAIDELKLTILRADGVSQVIAVDEDTSFRRGGRGMGMMMGKGGPRAGAGPGAGRPVGAPAGGGGESITLADVKVGDTVAGPGVVKGGVFVPTQLGVMDAAAAGRRRRQGDGAATAPPEPK